MLHLCSTPVKSGAIPYLKVTVKKGKIQATPRVHNLVLTHFAGERPEGKIARHLNGNYLDNRLTNLCWGTHAENTVDKIIHGTIPYGENHRRSKLTEKQVAYIRAQPHGSAQLARELGVTYALIKAIRRGKIWKRQLKKPI